MNQFLKKENQQHKNFFIIVIITVCIGLFLYFCYTKEKYIEDFYYENTLYTKETMNDDIEYAKQNDFSPEGFLNTQKQSKILLNKFNSLVSSDQSFFLQTEIDNQMLNVELSDEFEGLNYTKYTKGKVDINTYLIKHKLPLKSVEYSTDSAIFTMNTLEFLNTPIFFLLFFLVTPINYFKKYEDGRIKLLFVQPTERKTLLWIDYKLFLKNSLWVLLTTLFASSILAFCVSQKMTLNYPILITFLVKTIIIPIYLYIVLLCVTFFFIGTFIFLLVYFFLLMSKKAMVAILMTIFLCVSSNMILYNYGTDFSGLNPFSYVDTERLIKSGDTQQDIKYVLQSDRNIDSPLDSYVGNIVENPFYYANNSIANQSQTADIIMLPLVISLWCGAITYCNIFLLKKY